jgi:hypothetical protein
LVYVGRVKELESFALKIETGRVPDPARMEDFFACTIVVPTLSQIEEAERLVSSLFDGVGRRPPNDAETRKTASDFAFDDLRLYVARRSSVSGREATVALVALAAVLPQGNDGRSPHATARQ